MKQLNAIGLNPEKVQELAEKLNVLLANYSVFYQNARGYHWNIKGEKFFELHVKFEELYNNLFMKIDEVAERIRTLGYTPGHKFTSYLAVSEIKESDITSEGKACVEGVLAAFKVIISKERELLQLSADTNDEGTNALMSDYIREQEKMVWMYSAYLNQQ